MRKRLSQGLGWRNHKMPLLLLKPTILCGKKEASYDKQNLLLRHWISSKIAAAKWSDRFHLHLCAKKKNSFPCNNVFWATERKSDEKLERSHKVPRSLGPGEALKGRRLQRATDSFCSDRPEHDRRPNSPTIRRFMQAQSPWRFYCLQSNQYLLLVRAWENGPQTIPNLVVIPTVLQGPTGCSHCLMENHWVWASGVVSIVSRWQATACFFLESSIRAQVKHTRVRQFRDRSLDSTYSVGFHGRTKLFSFSDRTGCQILVFCAAFMWKGWFQWTQLEVIFWIWTYARIVVLVHTFVGFQRILGCIAVVSVGWICSTVPSVQVTFASLTCFSFGSELVLDLCFGVCYGVNITWQVVWETLEHSVSRRSQPSTNPDVQRPSAGEIILRLNQFPHRSLCNILVAPQVQQRKPALAGASIWPFIT